MTSDPGTLTSRTLEATWKENGVEMRMNIYFTGDSGATWADEVRIYDGEVAGDWLTARGIFFKTPLGAAWTGDEDITVADPVGPARPRPVRGSDRRQPAGRRRQARQRGSGCRPSARSPPRSAPVRSTPAAQLHCSGILQMSPAEAQLTLKKMGLSGHLALLHPERHLHRGDATSRPSGTVIIDDGTNIVGSDGSDPDRSRRTRQSPLAKPVPFPADCPQSDPNVHAAAARTIRP